MHGSKDSQKVGLVIIINLQPCVLIIYVVIKAGISMFVRFFFGRLISSFCFEGKYTLN